jgi:hypothetical protein
MPILGSLLVTLFGSLAGFFAQYFSKKLTVGLALVATLTTITVALLVGMRLAVSIVQPVIGSGNFAYGLGIAFPANSATCITTMVSWWSACTLYTWKRKALQLFAQA